MRALDATLVINCRVLGPQGQAPRGNILLRCGGCMQRTG